MILQMKIIDLLVNPITCMLLGTMYYIVLPSVLFFNDYLGLSFIQGVVSPYLNLNSRDIYLNNIFDFVIINLSFIFGFFIVFPLKINKSQIFDKNNISRFKSTSFSVFLLLMFFLMFVAIRATLSGYRFFSGYTTYDISVLGPLATLCFMSMWFYIYFDRKLFLILFMVAGTLLLGSGSRMFFLLPLLSLMLNSVFNSPRKILTYSMVLFLSIYCMLLVGLLREGSEISFEGLFIILFAEPVFTSIGTLFYFNAGRPDLGFPTDIIAAFVNFVPSFLYPDKKLVLDAIIFDENINNPFGAQSLLINLYKNFGWLYPFFMVSFGFYFGILYKYRGNRFFYVVYVMSMPFILLHFQREGFITVFKVLFFNGLIFPILLLFLFKVLYKRRRGEIEICSCKC